MSGDLICIDHLMVAVSDSAKAGEIFARMGFTVTPKSLMPGLSNCLVCFSSEHSDSCNYIELMSLEDPSAAPPPMPEVLKTPERPVSIVMATADAKATRSRLQKLGLETTDVIDLERQWALPSGEVIVPAFSVVIPAPGQAPYYWNLCQHKTPQHYSRPEFTQHPNNGTALKSIIAVAKDPAGSAAHFVRFWDASTDGTDPVIVKRGGVELHIHSSHSFKENYPGIELQRKEDHVVGFSVKAADLGRVKDKLEEAGFAPHVIGDKIAVDPTQASGCLVVFE